MEIFQVIDPIEDHGLGCPFPHGPQLKNSPLKGLGRREVVAPDVVDGPIHYFRIIKHEDLGVKDSRFHLPQARRGGLF